MEEELPELDAVAEEADEAPEDEEDGLALHELPQDDVETLPADLLPAEVPMPPVPAHASKAALEDKAIEVMNRWMMLRICCGTSGPRFLRKA